MSPSLLTRLWTYQRERFPLLAMLPMALAFSFSAVAYSRLASGIPGFIPLPRFFMGAFTALLSLFMLRVLDEHKDAEDDARYRAELPVPRGLISLSELRWVAGLLSVLAVLLNAWLAPRLLGPLALVALYMALMTKEFFVSAWLRARMLPYLLSHMIILPLIDFYTTGLDWLAEGRSPAPRLAGFLLVTYMNGVVVEIGRKLKAPESEREGVDSYTKAWGLKPATFAWLFCLGLTAVVAFWAGGATGLGIWRGGILLGFACLALSLGGLFLVKPRPGAAKRVEAVSGLWTLLMYCWLGLAPFLAQ